MFKRCFLSIGLGIFVCLATLALAVPQGNEGDEPNSPDAQERGIWIETKADHLTAQFCIGGGNQYSEEADQDKKRTKYGIGEFLTLTVMGKEILIGEEDKIEWEIEDKFGVVQASQDADALKGRKIYIVFRTDVIRGGEVVFTAKTQLKTARITLNVVFPAGISASHIPINGQAGTEASFPDAPFVVLTDNENIAGASMLLRLVVTPLDVSFKGLGVIERDAESPRIIRPMQPARSIALGHILKGTVFEVTETNFICNDRVGTHYTRAVLGDFVMNGLIMPQEWEWLCNWNVADAENGNPNQGLISGEPYVQWFFYEALDAGAIFKATVTKFGRTSTRENTPTLSPINFQ